MNDLLKPVRLNRNIVNKTLEIISDLIVDQASYDISDDEGKLLSSGVLSQSHNTVDLSSIESQPAIFLLQVGSRISIQSI
ncbi:MAG: hypothetical protein AAGC47_07715 [Bacteroidota bacterium]